jgi:hypothetical protein
MSMLARALQGVEALFPVTLPPGRENDWGQQCLVAVLRAPMLCSCTGNITSTRTRTRILPWPSTFTVSLPRTGAERSRRPARPLRMRSQPLRGGIDDRRVLVDEGGRLAYHDRPHSRCATRWEAVSWTGKSGAAATFRD